MSRKFELDVPPEVASHELGHHQEVLLAELKQDVSDRIYSMLAGDGEGNGGQYAEHFVELERVRIAESAGELVSRMAARILANGVLV